MSDELKKLLEDIAIKVRGKYEAEIHGFIRKRSYFHDFANGGDDLAALGARVILRLMDEYEEPLNHPNNLLDERVVDNLKDTVRKAKDPFTGPHWDAMYYATPNSWMQILAKCLCDLRDELRRLKEDK